MASMPETLPVVAPAVGVPGPKQGYWTYTDYAAIPDDQTRYEIVEGVLYVSPAPNIAHQRSVIRFGGHLLQHVEGRSLGIVLVSPVDVELPGRHGVVQPDVVVILNDNLQIVTPSHIVGAPDLVIEVASPSTATYDRRQKLDAYAAAGVREYWLADPIAQCIELLYLEEGGYVSAGIFCGAAKLPSRVLPDLPTRVEQFFA